MGRRRLGAVAGVVALGTALSAAPAAALAPDKAIHQYVRRVWQTKDGLPQAWVSGVAQTPDGYVWLSTQEGLARFDGARFTAFDKTNTAALVGSEVLYALATDGAGGVWAAVRGVGVVVSRAGAFRAITTAAGLSNDAVISLALDGRGVAWAGTYEHGLNKIEAGAVVDFEAKSALARETVTALAAGGDGVWVGTDEGGLVKLVDGRLAARYGTATGLASDEVGALHRDRFGDVWAGAGRAVYRLEGEGFRAAYGLDRPAAEAVRALCVDRDGNTWVGVQGRGLVRLRGGRVDVYGKREGLPDDVQALFEDRDGTLWVGMESGGLLALSDGPATTLGPREGLGGASANSVLETGAGELWVGGRGGVDRLEGGIFRPQRAKGGAPTERLGALYEDRGGTLWAGGRGRFGRREGDAFALTALGGELTGAMVNGFADGPDGALWLATANHGLARRAAGGVEPLAALTAVTGRELKKLKPGRGGGVWVGTNGRGAVRVGPGGEVQAYGRKDGLASDIVYDVLEDDDGAVWFGTSNGLSRLRGGALTSFLRDGRPLLPEAFVVLDDGLGHLWTSSNKGIARVAKRDLDEFAEGGGAPLRYRAFDEADGLADRECNTGSPAGVRSNDGRLWFATAAGLAVVDPARLPAPAPPRPLLEQVTVDRAPIALADGARLPPGRREFAFQYTAPAFVAPERVRFRYKLEGFDRDWIEVGHERRVAYYTNLPPGAYRFRVTAALGDGAWHGEGASVGFALAPFFYERRSFWAAAAAAAGFGAFGAYRARLRRLRARARELEARVRERTGELERANAALEERDLRIRLDLEQARAFQQRLLPALPGAGPLAFDAIYRPVDQVGGDLYDVCELGPGRARVFLADATGHGVQASLRTMVLKTEYDRVKALPGGPACVLEALNDKVARDFPGLEMACSACCFDVEASGGGGARVRYANAGHLPLLLLGPRGAVSEPYVRGCLVGTAEGVAFESLDFTIEPGGRLAAFTDGLTEQEGAAGEPFGAERAADALRRGDGLAALLDRLEAFGGGALADDVTVVLVSAPGEGAGGAPRAGAAAPTLAAGDDVESLVERPAGRGRGAGAARGVT